jgi:hypothetical protein
MSTQTALITPELISSAGTALGRAADHGRVTLRAVGYGRFFLFGHRNV